MKSYTIECTKGRGISYKRMIMDATAQKMGYEPEVFSNDIYKKLNTPRVILANMSTEIKAMSEVIYGGMPTKNAFFILTLLREDSIDISYEADLKAGLSGDKMNEAVEHVMSVLMRAFRNISRKDTAETGRSKI